MPDSIVSGFRDAAPNAALLDCVDDAIIVLDSTFTILYANRAATLLGDAGGAVGIGDARRSVAGLIHPDDMPLALEALQRVPAERRTTVRLRVVLPIGERPVEVSLTDHVTTPGIEGIVACFRNLEQEEALRASLERQRLLDQDVKVALTDELTGLPNRRLFLERLEHGLRRSERDSRPSAGPLGSVSDLDRDRDGTGDDAVDVAVAPLSVFFVDLDDFKAINDSLGHTAGDAMLRSTTNRLLNTGTNPDQWGRIGGDEFVLFLEECDHDRAATIAQQLRDSLRQPMVLGGRACYTSASVGVAVVDGGGVSADEALRRADIAMYEGKRIGHGLVTTFRPEMEQRVVVRTELEGQLRRSLIGSGPTIVFQPIVNLGSGDTVAVEALARWHSPTQGPIGPDRFVAMAEHMGIVDQLDRHVLRKACKEMIDQRDPGNGRLVDVTVNISTIHLASDDFARGILQIVEAAQFDPSRLVLEVTESIGVEYNDVLEEELKTLRANGVRIALDDFGTGHSSLAQLETLAVDYLKVDRTFLTGMSESPRRLRYVETIVDMAAALDLTVVFEGIETVEQARSLSDLGVTLGQGFLLAAPISAGDLTERMRFARSAAAEAAGD